MPPVEAVLVQTMYGTFEHPIGHKPTDAELDAIKDEYVAQGLDVISGRAVESPRIPPYQNA
jgi:hypothetical protein